MGLGDLRAFICLLNIRRVRAILVTALLCLSLAGAQAYAGCGERELLSSQPPKVYVYGSASGKLLHLTKQEYRRRAMAEDIDPDTILLLDEIDLEVDVPFVAGIVLMKPLTMEGTHVQVLAEKMAIPLVYIPGMSEEIAGQHGLFAIDTLPYIRLAKTDVTRPRAPITCVLPAEYPRAEGPTLVSVSQISPDSPPARELVGDKFLPLALFASRHFDLVPRLLHSLTSRVFETYMETKLSNGRTLRRHIAERLAAIEGAPEEVVRHALAEIRGIMQSTPLGTDLTIVAALFKGKISVRSNNDVEDKLAAGLYASTVANANPADLEIAIKKVFASMYSYRAFKIRRAWNQREENLSMPVMLHKYVEDEDFSAVARVRLNEKNEVEMAVTAVEGRATNPHVGAKTYKLTAFGTRNVIADPDTPMELVSQVSRLFQKIKPTLETDLRKKRFRPEYIDLELLFDSATKPTVLQYKHIYPREVVLAVLSGAIEQSTLDQYVSIGQNMSDEIADVAGGMWLKDMNRISNKYLRYALLKVQGRFEILVWENNMHETMREILRDHFPDIAWIRSGYLQYNPATALFKFTATTVPTCDDYGTLRDRELEKTIEADFASAIANARRDDSNFDVWIRGLKQAWYTRIVTMKKNPKILFNTGNLGSFKYGL